MNMKEIFATTIANDNYNDITLDVALNIYDVLGETRIKNFLDIDNFRVLKDDFRCSYSFYKDLESIKADFDYMVSNDEDIITKLYADNELIKLDKGYLVSI